jgi:hypothetical protein
MSEILGINIAETINIHLLTLSHEKLKNGFDYNEARHG